MSYTDPNFTIVTSGGCNSFCSFCTDPYKRKAAPDYLANLQALLASDYIPAHFHQVSITGGEPTLSPDFQAILEAVTDSGKFDKVVLTTNGAKLVEQLPLVIEHVDFLNVSRHAVGYESNVAIFGTRDIITDDALVEVCAALKTAGIPVNLNFVYGPQDEARMTPFYVNMMVGYAKALGADSISFRFDQNSNEMGDTFLEKRYAHLPVLAHGDCPVCRSHTVRIDGFPVTFKASFAEPSNAINDVFELIYHITGKLTTDWEGQHEFNFARRAQYLSSFDPNHHPAIVNPQAKITPKAQPRRAKRNEPDTTAVAAVTSPVAVKAQVIDTTALNAAVQRRNNVPRVTPLDPELVAKTTVDAEYAYGGTCGSFGGTCGSSRHDDVVKDNSYGGTCGAFVGGSCGGPSVSKVVRSAKSASNMSDGQSDSSISSAQSAVSESKPQTEKKAKRTRASRALSYGGSCGFFGGTCGMS